MKEYMIEITQKVVTRHRIKAQNEEVGLEVGNKIVESGKLPVFEEAELLEANVKVTALDKGTLILFPVH